MRVAAYVPLVALCLLLLPLGTARADTKPASLKELGAALDDLALRIAALIQEAGKDPAELKIDVYEKYTAQQLRLKKRDVRAEDLVQFMLDPKRNFNTREKVMNVLSLGPARGDPDLSRAEKKRGMSKRAWFSNQFLVANLDDDDRFARKLCKDLLEKWWNANAVAAILGYDVKDKKTWSKAKRAWTKYLRKK